MRRHLERAALQPALDLRPAVVAPEPLAVDDEEGRAEDAVRDRVVAHLAQPRLRRRRAPHRFGFVAVDAEFAGQQLQRRGVGEIDVAGEVGAQAVPRPGRRRRRPLVGEPPEIRAAFWVAIGKGSGSL